MHYRILFFLGEGPSGIFLEGEQENEPEMGDAWSIQATIVPGEGFEDRPTGDVYNIGDMWGIEYSEDLQVGYSCIRIYKLDRSYYKFT